MNDPSQRVEPSPTPYGPELVMAPKREAIMYIEQKSEDGASLNDRGPAVIARVRLSKTGTTVYYRDKTLRRIHGGGWIGNYYCLEDGNEYWVSGVKKRGSNRLSGSAEVVIEVSQDELDEALRQ